ncbi:MAG: GNAT family N-acetyltransferase [Balneola sp.]|nr:GNAT family N-acetyltransferase [Balneola sp.]MBO6649388.1 GNAT family N-acetyltransferase [Balneola sp.]MBO6711203.1 GNAT family N-acetyltransferase [Balneola sp.]MBO6800682.1 GNAT family N-acetyltransferase [Balneola sp.]MBO6869139.1 GNAT family N-acetyltransferase [Balneola sp.]
MKIEKATLSDLEELNELFDGYRVFYEKETDKSASQAFLKERIEQNESIIFISRNNDGVATGFVQLYPLFSSTRMKRFWLLNDLYVDQSYRGQGFSKALIEKSKKLCRETDACGMMLETAKDNHVGNQLYPATGWSLDEDHNFYTWDVE